ncbi:L-alanine exporter AlaE [Vibrio sp. EA2]|uniref:L-alanine exporter AlaE n=1 Tax=Vibrio sp. EA2 TaxID=3079860 RepID=UPI002949B3C4|nr:L-alanine exporter AlaE [Vibrio sp. EA2]MDV6254260.1 L-alanine exporter AlaE [Vibrio sp. EA2]
MSRFIVDTAATIVFFTLLAAFTEYYIAGMDFDEVLITRLLMVPMMIVTGRPYGLWRDWLFLKLLPSAPWGKAVVDCIAFLAFQVPTYAVTLMIAGADYKEIITLLISATVTMIIISRPFGLFLETVRVWARVA